MPLNILKMKSKKAQTRMLETIAVIFAFFLLAAFGFVFYANMQADSDKIKLEAEKDTMMLKIAKLAISLPELQCNNRMYCMDEINMKTFFDTRPATKSEYYDLFKNSVITVEKVYPTPESPVTIYSKQKGSSKKTMWLPISLYDPVKDSTSFGILRVDLYE